ncbi:MAG TPA: AMP-binding protein [Thermoanaerobaculia bacterium]|nr:AMP-binding protein [Thermoanaerobaculia bacterium]
MSAAAASLIETLERRGRNGGDRAACWWRGRPLAWRQLGRGIDATARALHARGVAPGDRVLLVIEEGDAFLSAFWGALRAGAVAVPMLPRSGAGRLLDTAAWLGAAGIVADREPAERWQELQAALPSGGPWLLDGDEAAAAPAGTPLPAAPAQDQVAFLQLTSGTTGAQKAVRIRHRDLAKNVQQMSAGFGITGDDVFLSWLPLHHDMGLILMSMVPLAHGCALHLQPPGMPAIRGWMDEAARCGATFTAAPDFAYRLCLRLARERDGLDLSRLRVALDAAEPVRASTVEEFERAFGLANVITPAYGLAEATVGVSTWPPGTPIRVDARGYVAVGAGFPGVRLRVDGESGSLPAGEVGEVKVASPSLAAGYWGDPLPIDDDDHRWLSTGDLGYLDADGILFIAGRSKEVINLGGLTLAPREIEETVDRLPFVRRSAAVGIDRGRLEGEQVFVFVELLRGARGEREEQSAAVVAAFHERLGMRPGRVCLLESGAIPMTANGKLRYGELRRLYLEGELKKGGALLFPDA